MNKKIISGQSKYEWIWYVFGYLSIARISLEKLKSDKYPEKSWENKIIYNDKFVLIAAIWSIKHAIELITKSLGIIIDKTYLKSHDCGILANDLTEKLRPLNIYKPEKIDELATIIDKYYRLKFWNNEFFVDERTFDTKNDMFRYPNDHISVRFVNDATVAKIDELIKDIETLRRLRAIIDISLQAKGLKSQPSI
ncbi:MAG: hypothetical protein WC297_03685 [Candidatus Paceibacterota bacterium]|jgi:hypothetical protein